MSTPYKNPGVITQELTSSIHPITSVATSIAAFVGYTSGGVDGRAKAIGSFSDFQQSFGGLHSESELSYAVQQFFLNGGSQAIVVRVPKHGATAATVSFGGLTFCALSTGAGVNGDLTIDADVSNLNLGADPLAFNLTVRRLSDDRSESFAALTLDHLKSNFVGSVINDPAKGSQLVEVATALAAPPIPVVATGIIGSALQWVDVNTAVCGTSNGTVAAADFGLVLTLPGNPALCIAAVIFRQGSPVPKTIAGVAVLLQQVLNAALAHAMLKAVALCTVIQAASAGQAIRVVVDVPDLPAARITFVAPATGGDASAVLGLAHPATANVAHYTLGSGESSGAQTASVPGSEGTGLPCTADLIGEPSQFSGMYALLKTDLFNLLSIPDATRAIPGEPLTLDPDVDPATIYRAAAVLCDQRRAMLLVDPPPGVKTIPDAADWMTSGLGLVDPNGAAYFPRLQLSDPLNGSKPRIFAPSGAVAGVIAATDAKRGVWKAPAGVDAVMQGVQSMTCAISDLEASTLNALGLNSLRSFPAAGPVVWGARTLAGADAQGSQWQYLPVRRMALFLEESLNRGTQCAVFEQNDEALWASIRLNAGAFMNSMYRKGAFQGSTPEQAYFVKCDGESTTQADVERGVLNILIGFAPLKPAEFVVLQITQPTRSTDR